MNIKQLMKNLLLILFIFFVTSNCYNSTNEDPKNTIPPELIGKWKIVELYTSDGSNSYWHTYDSGREWDTWFKSDGTYTLSYPYTDPNCMGGTYSILENDITFSDNPCTDGTPVTIEVLTENELQINSIFFEIYKSKSIKVIE